MKGFGLLIQSCCLGGTLLKLLILCRSFLVAHREAEVEKLEQGKTKHRNIRPENRDFLTIRKMEMNKYWLKPIFRNYMKNEREKFINNLEKENKKKR